MFLTFNLHFYKFDILKIIFKLELLRMIGYNILLKPSHLKLIFLKFFSGFNQIDFLFKSIFSLLVCWSDLFEWAFLLCMVVNFEWSIWTKELGVSRTVVVIWNGFAFQGISYYQVQIILDLGDFQYLVWFGTVSDWNHLVKTLWVGSVVHQRLQVIFINVL